MTDRMFTQPYHKLLVWKKADEFVLSVYKITRVFPKEERFGIISQLRRAASSVPLNIVEGQGRKSTKDFIRFLINARGSCSECAYLLELSYKLKYLTVEDFQSLERNRREVNFLLQRMIQGLNNSI